MSKTENYKIFDIILSDVILLFCIIAGVGVSVPLLLYQPKILFFITIGIIGLCSYALTVRVRAREN